MRPPNLHQPYITDYHSIAVYVLYSIYAKRYYHTLDHSNLKTWFYIHIKQIYCTHNSDAWSWASWLLKPRSCSSKPQRKHKAWEPMVLWLYIYMYIVYTCGQWWCYHIHSYPMMLMRRRTMRGFHASFAQLSWQFFSTTPRACGSIQPQFSRKVRGTKPQTSKLQGIGIFLEEKLEGKQLKTYISCESLSTIMASNCWSWDFRSIAPCENSVL